MYIYKLGHSPDFGVREFEFLTKQTALWHNQNWLISQDFCDTSVCGSLIFGGQIANDLEIQGLENWKLENQAKFNKSFNEIENEAQIKNSKNLQNTNNSLQNWNEENKSLGQKLKINLSELENELENLDEIDNKNLLALLGEFLTNNPYKKVGIAILTSFDQQKVMNLAKKCGSKKINIISCLPNYGHWKSCKKWLVIIQNPIRKISQKDENVNNYKTENLAESFQNLQKLQFQKFILFEIKSFCNQEFWANLDQNLPSGEMSRGLMNLKLARTLVNLTDKKIILDPFCGSGRTMAAGFGLDKKFILSDVEEVCAKEVSDNLEFLENEKNGKLWKKNQDLSEKGLESDLENDPETENLEQDKNEKIQQNNLQNLEQNLHQNLNENSQLNLKNSQNELSKTLKTSKLLGNLTLDATELGKLQNQKEMENLDFGDISIVTEGFLGTNFKNTPNSKQIQAEFENLELIWTKTLSQSSKLGIEEIIFCLPFYNLKKSENLGGDKLETKNGIKKINHKKRFAENVEFDKSYNNSNKKINSQKSQKTDNSTSFDHKINKNDKLQKIELEEDFEEQFEIKNKNKERNMTKPKLITSNLAAKSTNYQSKSQTWTPQNNSKDNFKKDYKKGSFDSKNSEKKVEFGKKFVGNAENSTKSFGSKFGNNNSKSGFGKYEKNYEKSDRSYGKNYGKSQNKRGSLDYGFGKSDYNLGGKLDDKMDKKSRRSFGNINKTGKPTSYKVKPKFETENRKRKESREIRENRINTENSETKYQKMSENRSETKNYNTKSPNLKPQTKNGKNNYVSKDASKNSLRNNSQNHNSQNLEPKTTYSNFSKSQTWENSQKNYQNRWENVNNGNNQNSKFAKNSGQTKKENYRENYKTSQKSQNPKTDFKNSNSNSEQKENNVKISNQIILPLFLDKLIENSDYEFVWENKHLLYSRDTSFVGHLVIKLKLKK